MSTALADQISVRAAAVAAVEGPLESTILLSRRIAVTAERRRQRLGTSFSVALAGVGGIGALAFAGLMVSLR